MNEVKEKIIVFIFVVNEDPYGIWVLPRMLSVVGVYIQGVWDESRMLKLRPLPFLLTVCQSLMLSGIQEKSHAIFSST